MTEDRASRIRNLIPTIRAAILFALAAVCPAVRGATPAQPPNVILIVCDDLNSYVSTSGNQYVQTPNLDRFAASGVTFSRAYCQYPVCNPSRASFLTGLYPETTGVLNNKTDIRKSRPGTVTLPELFRRNGYWTGGTGKVFHRAFDQGSQVWDEVHFYEDERALIVQKLRRHFESIHGDPDLPENRDAWGQTLKESLVANSSQNSPGYGPTDLADEEHGDGQRVRQVARWLDDRPFGDRPFFIACGLARPHTPYWAPRRYFDLYPVDSLRPASFPADDWNDIPPKATTDRYLDFGFEPGKENTTLRRKYLQAYLACVSFVDAQLGLILDAVDSHGLADNTIVVFVSDHGFLLGEHFLWGKVMLFEESARVPLIVRAPGVAPQGSKAAGLVELVDLYPTLAELCHLSVPADVQGRSFAEQLANPARPGRETAYSVVNRGENLGRSIRTTRWRYAEWFGPAHAELYDLDNDPQELTNLANDPQYADVAAQMHTKLAERAGMFRSPAESSRAWIGLGAGSVCAAFAAALLVYRRNRSHRLPQTA